MGPDPICSPINYWRGLSYKLKPNKVLLFEIRFQNRVGLCEKKGKKRGWLNNGLSFSPTTQFAPPINDVGGQDRAGPDRALESFTPSKLEKWFSYQIFLNRAGNVEQQYYSNTNILIQVNSGGKLFLKMFWLQSQCGRSGDMMVVVILW